MAVIEDIKCRQTFNVRLVGRVDSSSKDQLAEVMTGLLKSESFAQIDLSNVTTIDSNGVDAFLHWHRCFLANDSRLHITHANPTVKKAFQLAGRADITSRAENRLSTPEGSRYPITDCIATSEDCVRRSFSVPGRLNSCKVVRDKVSQMTAEMPFTDEEKGDIRLAVGEAISNAIRHGCRDQATATVAVRCVATKRNLVVEISDNGSGFDADAYIAPSIPDDLPESGMGIKFMRQYMDDVSFQFSSGTTIRLIKHVRS